MSLPTHPVPSAATKELSVFPGCSGEQSLGDGHGAETLDAGGGGEVAKHGGALSSPYIARELGRELSAVAVTRGSAADRI